MAKAVRYGVFVVFAKLLLTKALVGPIRLLCISLIDAAKILNSCNLELLAVHLSHEITINCWEQFNQSLLIG